MIDNIIIMSYNYYPDISPSSFRMASLVKNLSKFTKEEIQLNIICSEPNRYNIKFNIKDLNNSKKVKIFRSKSFKKLPIFGKYFSYFSYIILCIWVFYKLKKKFVIVTTSKLGTALFCFTLSYIFKFKYYVDLRDLLSENLYSLLSNYNYNLSKLVKFILLNLEKKILIRAKNVNVVALPFKDYYQYNGVDVSQWTTFTNGIDDIFLKNNFSNKKNINQKKNILYVGNNGFGQALDKILPKAAKSLEHRYIFYVVGSGSNHKKLKKLINKYNIKNIQLLGPLPREHTLDFYKKSDILFLHLNNVNSFEKVLPSKIFEYICVGKPIIAGIPDGYALSFLKENTNYFLHFQSCNHNDLINKLNLIDNLKIDFNQIENFKNKYSRSIIMSNMSKSILKFIR